MAAAVCLAVGAGAGSAATWWELRRDGPHTSAARALSPPPHGEARGEGEVRGEVRMVRTGEGQEASRVRVTVRELPSPPGYYEVWLMDRTHGKLIPLGALGAHGSTTLSPPRGVDTEVYALLDVSAQPCDGSTAHSGRSVVRGPLPAVPAGGGAGA